MAVPGVLRGRTVYSGAAGMLCQELGRSALQCQTPAHAVRRDAGQAPPPSSPHWGSRGMQDRGDFPPCWVSVAELGVLGLGGASQGFRGANTAQTPAGTQGFCAGLARAPYPSQRFSAPAARGFFPLPCGKASPTAITQLLLPCLESRLHLHISKGFLGSLFPPSMLR